MIKLKICKFKQKQFIKQKKIMKFMFMLVSSGTLECDLNRQPCVYMPIFRNWIGNMLFEELQQVHFLLSDFKNEASVFRRQVCMCVRVYVCTCMYVLNFLRNHRTNFNLTFKLQIQYIKNAKQKGFTISCIMLFYFLCFCFT